MKKTKQKSAKKFIVELIIKKSTIQSYKIFLNSEDGYKYLLLEKKINMHLIKH